VLEIQMDRLELSEFLAGVIPHIDHMRNAQLPELFNVTVQSYFAPKRKPLSHEENDHKLISPLFGPGAPSQQTFRRLEN